MPNIKEMTKSILNKYVLARSSDEALFDMILLHYFGNDFHSIPRPVAFINSLVRERRKQQMLGLYEAKPEVKERRRRNSKFWAKEMIATKKEISKIALSR